MTKRAVFAYNNLDDTADLNVHFRTLIGRGVVSGGEILPVAGTSNVTVNPFYATSYDGMVVWDTVYEPLNCVPGIVNVIVLRAVYNSPAAPTLQFEVMTTANYNSDPQKNNLIVFGEVDMTGASTTALAQISYAKKDITDKLAHNKNLGVYANLAALTAAWSNAVPVKQQPNDYALVIDGINGHPAYYYWTGTAFSDFGNYEVLKSDYTAHTAGVIGSGLTVHVTADEKAGLAGTFGIPSATNRFVTEGDLTRVLTSDQKAAIDNALAGGPLSSTNPVIGDGLPVVITKLVNYTIQVEQDFINITRGDQGSGAPFFGAPVFTGKLGLDTLNGNKSSARQYFKVEDARFNGYMDEDGPLYIVDILDPTGASAFNPATSSDVGPIGYWDPAASTAALRVKFNRTIAAGKTIYLRYNAKGKISQLAPSGAYAPPSTGFRAGIEAYQEIHTQVVTAQTVVEAHVTNLMLADGSSIAPSLSFINNQDTGFYYSSSIGQGSAQSYSAVNVAIDGETTVVFSRKQPTGSGSLDPNELPLVIEQDYNEGLGQLTYKIFTYNDQTANTAMGIEFGEATYNSAFTRYLRIGRGETNPDFGTTFFRRVFMADGVQFLSDAGTEVAPGISFKANRDTGFYYLGTAVEQDRSFYNAMGLSLNGKTAFAFATNTISNPLNAGLRGTLVFEQAVTDADTVEFRQLIDAGTSSAINGFSHVFGSSNYSNDSIVWFSIDSSNTKVHRNLWVADSLKIGGSDEDNQNLKIDTTANSFNISLDNAGILAYSGSTLSITGGLSVSAGATIANGLLVSSGRVRVASGSEGAPSLAFNGTTTGLYYAGTFSTTGIKTRAAMGVAVEGVSTLLIGRNEANPGGLAPNEVPLLIEQMIDGSTVETRIAQIDRVTGGAGGIGSTAISMGFGDYTDDYRAWFTLTNSFNATDAFNIAVQTRFEKPVRFLETARVDGLLRTSQTYSDTPTLATGVGYSFGSLLTTGLFGEQSANIGLALAGNTVLRAAGSLLTVSMNTNFQGTADFYQPVVFHNTVDIDLSLTDLNDITWLTGTTLQSFMQELGLDIALPGVGDPANGANIREVLNAMDETQADRVSFINFAKQNLDPFTGLINPRSELIIAANQGGLISARQYDGYHRDGGVGSGGEENMYTRPATSIPVRTVNWHSTVDTPADFTTRTVSNIVPLCFKYGVPAQGTVIHVHQTWGGDPTDASPDGLRIWCKLFEPSPGVFVSPSNYGTFEIQVEGGVCGVNANPITLYLPYADASTAPGYPIAYQELIIPHAAGMTRTIKLINRAVVVGAYTRTFWQPIIWKRAAADYQTFTQTAWPG